MRHACVLLLSCLLLAEASPLITIHFPFYAPARIMRSVRLMRNIMRMGMLIRRFSITRRLVGLTPFMMLHRQDNGRDDPCLMRLACEAIKGSTSDNQIVKIFMSLGEPEKAGSSCGERHGNCPLVQMMRTLKQLRI